MRLATVAVTFALAIILGIAGWYGHDMAMSDGFRIQGYIGALIPIILVLFGVWIGVWFGSAGSEEP